jgi:uridylate kinase
MITSPNNRFTKVLLKISGEALGGKKGEGFDPAMLYFLADQIGKVKRKGVNMGIVVGAGNIFRGQESTGFNIDPIQGDFIGMEATVINALMIQEVLHQHKITSVVLSALGENNVVESYTLLNAKRYFHEGKIVICAGGTGNPFFTTDTAAVMRGLELGCDVVLKATKVDGVYSDDPMKNKKAKRYTTISFDEALEKHLHVMDETAFMLAKEYHIPIIVFNLFAQNSIVNIISGKNTGTLVS